MTSLLQTGGIGNAAPEMLKEETGYIYTDREMSDGGNFFCNSFFNDQMTGDGLKLSGRLVERNRRFLDVEDILHIRVL